MLRQRQEEGEAAPAARIARDKHAVSIYALDSDGARVACRQPMRVDHERTQGDTMAEQFILANATSKMLKPFLKALTCDVTDLAHANVGWTIASRAAYNGLMGLNGAAPIVNRGGLPPHFYIEIPAGLDDTALYKGLSAGDGDLVRGLSRGVVPTVLKALSQDGATAWAQGRKPEAVRAEAAKGNVSISIYHLDGVEVGQTEQTKVDGF